MLLLTLFIVLLPVLRVSAWCEPAGRELATTKVKVQNYEQDVNASKTQQKDDKEQMLRWTDEYQIKRLDATMKYRLQMIRHQEHSLKGNDDLKWIECLFVYSKEIRRSITYYHDNEHKCLKTATSKDSEAKDQVESWDKQIASWRKSYRYLVNLCSNTNRNNEMARRCLVEHMQNDKYDKLIKRLMHLKQQAMEDLHSYFESSLAQLEECLRTQLSRYVDRIRSLMGNLKKCYILKA